MVAAASRAAVAVPAPSVQTCLGSLMPWRPYLCRPVTHRSQLDRPIDLALVFLFFVWKIFFGGDPGTYHNFQRELFLLNNLARLFGKWLCSI